MKSGRVAAFAIAITLAFASAARADRPIPFECRLAVPNGLPSRASDRYDRDGYGQSGDESLAVRLFGRASWRSY